MRKLRECTNCGEPREMAAHGLCFRCYRREARAEEKDPELIDVHTPGIRKGHKKLIKAFNAVLTGLADLGVDRNRILRIVEIVRPYVAPVSFYFTGLVEDQSNAEAISEEDNSDAGNESEREQNVALFTFTQRSRQKGN